MRDFAKVSPHIWTSDIGRKIKNLGIEARVISLYLETNPSAHMTGVYYIPIVLIAHEAGLSVEQVTTVLNQLNEIGFCSYDYDYEYIWVHEMGLNQVSTQLKSNDNRVIAIKNHFVSLPKLSFLQSFYDKYAGSFHLDLAHCQSTSLQPPSNTLQSNEKENKNENEKEKNNVLSGEPDVMCENKIPSFEKTTTASKKECATAYLSQATEILNFLNKKTNRCFRHEDINLKLIVARLKSGVSVDDCRAVIARKFRDWKGTDMQKYLRPATLFNAMKFEQYLGECVAVTNVQIKELRNEPQ